MQDFKFDIEVKVTAKPVTPNLGLDNSVPVERNMMVVSSKAVTSYVGSKADAATKVANAILLLENKRILDTNLSPEVTTGAASAITASSATINGTGHSHAVATTLSFVTGTTRDPATARTATSGGSTSTDAFTAVTYNMTGLSASTRYYYRTKAVSAGGTVYGPLKSFITPAT